MGVSAKQTRWHQSWEILERLGLTWQANEERRGVLSRFGLACGNAGMRADSNESWIPGLGKNVELANQASVITSGGPGRCLLRADACFTEWC